MRERDKLRWHLIVRLMKKYMTPEHTSSYNLSPTSHLPRSGSCRGAFALRPEITLESPM